MRFERDAAAFILRVGHRAKSCEGFGESFRVQVCDYIRLAFRAAIAREVAAEREAAAIVHVAARARERRAGRGRVCVVVADLNRDAHAEDAREQSNLLLGLRALTRVEREFLFGLRGGREKVAEAQGGRAHARREHRDLFEVRQCVAPQSNLHRERKARGAAARERAHESNE